MKKSILYLSVFLLMGVLSFTSCDEDEVSGNSIVGLWTFQNVVLEAENSANPNELEQEKGIIALASLLLQGTTIEFNADRSFTLIAVGETYEGTYTKNGDKFTVTIDGESTTVDNSVLSSDSYITVENNVLTIAEDVLDEDLKSRGFTKYIQKIVFKK